MGYSRQFALRGGLVSYNTDFADETRVAANWVGRILNGTMPADLPVRKSSKFDLVITVARAVRLVRFTNYRPSRRRTF
jgi:putative ABC transport system substrate-binding protein